MNLTALPAIRSAREAVRARTQRLLAPQGHFGRWFENLILALIVLSVASVILEETPGLPEWGKRAFRIEEIVVVVVFTLESCCASRRPRKYWRSSSASREWWI
jgi:hypothetical protein